MSKKYLTPVVLGNNEVLVRKLHKLCSCRAVVLSSPFCPSRFQCPLQCFLCSVQCHLAQSENSLAGMFCCVFSPFHS